MAKAFNPYNALNVKIQQQLRVPTPRQTQGQVMRSAKMGNVHAKGHGSMFRPIKPGNLLARGPDSLPIRNAHFQPNLVQAPKFN